jgi:hypothetical protein
MRAAALRLAIPRRLTNDGFAKTEAGTLVHSIGPIVGLGSVDVTV